MRGSRVLQGLMAGAAALSMSLVFWAAPPAAAATLKERLKTAQVPSMCEYPAGTLVNGHLPGTAPGNVDLDLGSTRLGTLAKGKGTGAVAVFHCSQGGVSWPDHVVFYDRNLNIIGQLDSGDIGYYSGRAVVSKVEIKKSGVLVHLAAIGQTDDSDQWGSTGALVKYSWSTKQKAMVRTSTTIYRERPTAVKLVKLIRAQKTAAASALATKATVKAIAAAFKGAKKVTVGACDGWSYYSDNSVGPDLGERGCEVDVDMPGDGDAGYLLTLSYSPTASNWARWRATRLVCLAGGC